MTDSLLPHQPPLIWIYILRVLLKIKQEAKLTGKKMSQPDSSRIEIDKSRQFYVESSLSYCFKTLITPHTELIALL